MTLSTVGFVLVAISLGMTQWSIFGAQTALELAALLWLFDVLRRGHRVSTPPFFVPLLAYGALTLVSAAFSDNPWASLTDSKQLLLFLMVPVVAHFARGERATQVLDVIIALGSAGALVGILQYFVLGYDNLDARPVGPLSHWMTFSGVLMLVTGAALARLLYFKKEWIWPAIAVPALIAALVLSLTRNAWLGSIAALVVLLAIRNWKLLLILPVAALVLALVAPGAVLSRIESIGDMNDPATRDRVAMLRMGVHMVKDHPLVGVGPEMVQRVYAQYRDPLGVNPTNPHLHNVPVQIAAERGLPALAVWLWFVVVAFRGLWNQLRHGPAKAVAGAGLAALVAMLVAGLFEYNFGDSEFLMLFLGLITLPYAAACTTPTNPAPGLGRSESVATP
ncbi:MAG: O-antigen ligase family protein [Acidobacteria bacterium]|jgi:O-antigen ligase|nr:O-antigen ligase family protein [Acidobacteriota bacterium]